MSIPISAQAANPFQNCALYLKNLFKSEPVVPLEIPNASRVYSRDPKVLLAEGQLQRAVWNWKAPAKNWVPEVENFLRTSEVVSEEPLSHGITHAKKVDLEGVVNGITVRAYAVQKTVGAENEVAFYELEKSFGLEFSPVTVERRVNGKKVSLQLFVDDAVSAEDLNRLTPKDHGSMALDMIDYLTGNLDRTGNYLLTLDEHRLVSIDAGFAFTALVRTSLKPYRLAGHFDEAAKAFLEKLKNTTDEAITQTLSGHLPKPAILDVLKRRQNLLEFMKKNFESASG